MSPIPELATDSAKKTRYRRFLIIGMMTLAVAEVALLSYLSSRVAK